MQGTAPADPKLAAERMALDGERLVTHQGFMFADRVFQNALKIDPKNVRARLYRAILRAPLKLRGLYKRIRPLAQKGSPWFRSWLRRAPEDLADGGLRAFMLDAPAEDIDTETKFQAWLSELRIELGETRRFLKANKDIVLRIKLSLPRQMESFLAYCPVIETSPDVFQSPACPYVVKREFDLDRADLEQMQIYAAGLEAWSIVATAFGVDGLIEVEKRNNYETLALTDKQMIETALAQPAFGALRADHRLAEIPSLGADALAAAQWGRRVRALLCPFLNARGAEVERPERARHLFPFCIRERSPDGMPIDEAFSLLASLLQGKASSVAFRRKLSEDSPIMRTTQFNPARVLIQPPAHLRALAPTRYDACDQPRLPSSTKRWPGSFRSETRARRFP